MVSTYSLYSESLPKASTYSLYLESFYYFEASTWSLYLKSLHIIPIYSLCLEPLFSVSTEGIYSEPLPRVSAQGFYLGPLLTRVSTWGRDLGPKLISTCCQYLKSLFGVSTLGLT